MRYSPETLAAMAGLRELKHKVDRADALEQSIDELHKKAERINGFVQNADSRITKLPDNNYITLEEQYRQEIFKEFNGRVIAVRLIIMVLIVALGIAGIAIMLGNSEVFDARRAAHIANTVDAETAPTFIFTSNLFVAILYMAAVTVAAVIYSFTETMSPFDKLDEWVSLYGAMFFITAWCAPVVLAISCMYFLFKINPIFALIPLAIVGGMVGCRVMKFMGVGQEREFTHRERRKLAEAQALDEQNMQINKEQGAAAIAKAAAAARPTLQTIDKEIREKTALLSTLKEEIAQNEILYPEDLPGIGVIIRLLETGRAESVKEALAIYDRQQSAAQLTAELLRREQK